MYGNVGAVAQALLRTCRPGPAASTPTDDTRILPRLYKVRGRHLILLELSESFSKTSETSKCAPEFITKPWRTMNMRFAKLSENLGWVRRRLLTVWGLGGI